MENKSPIIDWLLVLRARHKKVLRLHIVLAVAMAFLITLTTFGFYLAQQKSKSILTTQAQKRQQILARAGSKSLESFFQLLSNAFLILDHTIVITEANTQLALNNFVNDWQNTPVLGVFTTDERGIINHFSNRTRQNQAGADVSDREYFTWAQTAGQDDIYLSKPFISKLGESKGKFVVALATPVKVNSEFKGVLTVAILLSDVTEQYLVPLKLSEETYVHVFDAQGKWLASSKYPELTGVNYFEYIQEYAYSGSETFANQLKALLQNPQEATFITTPIGAKNTKNKLLVAVSPLHVKKIDKISQAYKEHWFLAMVAPQEKVMQFFIPLENTNTVGLILAVMILVIFSMMVILLVRIAQREAYLKGLEKGRWLCDLHMKKKK